MKRLCFVAICVLSLSACKSTWDEEAKSLYTQSCMEDANRWAASPKEAKTYCDCMLEKVMTKYPDVNEILEHPEKLMDDPELRKCKPVADTTQHP
ncbi:MAG: hypothetical protein WCG87_00515 [Bacteroidota bacterium]